MVQPPIYNKFSPCKILITVLPIDTKSADEHRNRGIEVIEYQKHPKITLSSKYTRFYVIQNLNGSHDVILNREIMLQIRVQQTTVKFK